MTLELKEQIQIQLNRPPAYVEWILVYEDTDMGLTLPVKTEFKGEPKEVPPCFENETALFGNRNLVGVYDDNAQRQVVGTFSEHTVGRALGILQGKGWYRVDDDSPNTAC